MRSLLSTFTILFILSSCTSTSNLTYTDPNYLSSKEFRSYEEITTTVKEETIPTSLENELDSKYNEDEYHDYGYSSRIRRFHRPMHYNYYSGIYTDYWYNNDPFFLGASTYSNHNWHSPYYSYYSYNPYYNNYLYTPYYSGSYYLNGYKYYHESNYNLNTNNNYSSYISGKRGGLSSSVRRNLTLNTRYISRDKDSNKQIIHNRKTTLDKKNINQKTVDNNFRNNIDNIVNSRNKSETTRKRSNNVINNNSRSSFSNTRSNNSNRETKPRNNNRRSKPRK